MKPHEDDAHISNKDLELLGCRVVSEKNFKVGDKIDILKSKWHIKEFPQAAEISKVLVKGFMFRCKIEGRNWELGPYTASELRSRKTPLTEGKSKGGQGHVKKQESEVKPVSPPPPSPGGMKRKRLKGFFNR